MIGKLRRAVASALVAFAVIAAAAYVIPGRPRNPLAETFVWSLIVLTAFAGWGSAVRSVIARHERVDLGLRMVWGASAVAFIGGVLMVPSAMTRTVSLLLVDAGVAFALAALVYEREAVRRSARFVRRVAVREPRLALVCGLVCFVLALHFAAGIAEWHTNPYDDDIAYLAFARKLGDTGSFPEPFSFRRLSAMGGQTFFEAMTLVRGGARQAHAFDRSVCVMMVVLLLVGHRSGRRRPSILFLVLAITAFLTLPSTAINTASYFSGVAFFLGLYRTLVWLGDRPRSPWRAALPLALVSAAACTLRQNFLPVPAFTLAISYLVRFVSTRGSPPRARLAEPAFLAGFTAIGLAPWMIAQYQSNGTFLYPFMLGTFNPALQLKAAGMSWIRELHYQVWVGLEGMPTKTIGLFVIVAAFVRERANRRPLWSFLAGSAGGTVMLVHGLTQSDAGNIGRYALGFLLAFVLAAALAASTVRLTPRLSRPHVAAGLAIAGLLLELVDSRTKLYTEYERDFHNIEELAAQPPRWKTTEPPELELYAKLQGSVPDGQRIAILLDEPYYLDFRRNPIWNLDMPGYSSLPPGIPFFKGIEALEGYFTTIGVRYLAFVRPQYSRYHYRRDYWVEMVANEQEIWRAFAPYLLDFMDSLVSLADRHKRLFEERGIVVVDLAGAP